jgi:hypothetical protein
MEIDLHKYVTPQQFLEKHKAFSMTWLRTRMWRRRYYGLDEAVVKVGRKFYIHEEKFFEWFESHKDKRK